MVLDTWWPPAHQFLRSHLYGAGTPGVLSLHLRCHICLASFQIDGNREVRIDEFPLPPRLRQTSVTRNVISNGFPSTITLTCCTLRARASSPSLITFHSRKSTFGSVHAEHSSAWS